VPAARLTSFVLLVSDVAASKEFYSSLLDQEVTSDLGGVNVSFASGLALWDRQHARGVIHDGVREYRDGDQNVEVYLETDDVDAMVERFRARGVPFVHDVVTQPWQQRVFRVLDPDGFIVEVAEAMDDVLRRLHADGLTVEEIAERTFMPADAVRRVVGATA
jgi:catechol 2,3-dioxygenase-like lactoylglutathione lyase family enzyme